MSDNPTSEDPALNDSATNQGYACPRTGTPLHLQGTSFQSRDGDIRYPIHNGIPHFLNYDPAEDPEAVENLNTLNRVAKEKDWRQAVKHAPQFEAYVTDMTRAIYLDLLPLGPQDVVLEIGTGLGQFTPLIAKKVKKVYGLEVVPGQAEFTSERCRQEGMTNVDIACGGDNCKLPYQDNQMDVVVLNLVLEWCATRMDDIPAIEGQSLLLREIFRLLKPGGVLYLSTKNRYALRLLLGKPDEHTRHVRFGSALPRWLLSLVLKLGGKPLPQGKLHSYPKLRSMLRETGFATIRSYWATPDMRYPTDYILTDPDSIRSARRTKGFSQGEYRSTRLVMPWVPSRLVKYVAPGLVFLATKDGIP